MKASATRRMTAEHRRRSMNMAVAGTVGDIIGATSLSGSVLNLAALKLGASDFTLGVLNFVIFGAMFFRVFTMATVESHGKRKVLIFWQSVSSLMIIPLLFLSYLTGRFSQEICLYIILGATLLRSATIQLASTGWFPLLQDIVPRGLTGRFFGNMRTTYQTVSLLIVLIYAWFLGRGPEWWKFSMVFAVGFAAVSTRIFAFFPMKENPPRRVKAGGRSVIERFREVLADKRLRQLMLYIFFYTFAMVMAEPFKIKYLKDLGYSAGFILAATSMLNVGAILTLRFWGRLADQFGNNCIFKMSTIGMPTVMMLWVIVDRGTLSMILIFILFFAHSVFQSGNEIGQTRSVLHAVSADKQNQINVITIISNISMGISPLIAGMFLHLTGKWNWQFYSKTFTNYHIFFILSGLMFMVPRRLLRSLKEPQDKSMREVFSSLTAPVLKNLGFISSKNNIRI